jgi:hypothetical protein
MQLRSCGNIWKGLGSFEYFLDILKISIKKCLVSMQYTNSALTKNTLGKADLIFP